MPYREMVARKYWCPGPLPWQWFDTCTRLVLGWCYNFNFYKTYGWGIFTKVVACEGKTEYSWVEGPGPIGTNTQYNVTACYDEERPRSGTCEENLGVNIGAFTPRSEPYISDLNSDVHDLKSNVVETGTFEFTAESGGLCQQGLWPWKRVLHEQVITASVTIRHVVVQWYIGGIPIVSKSGTISINAFCRWPFPLPKGRSGNRVVNVKYEVITDVNKSTLKIFNDPVDGSYSLSVGMSALVGGKEYTSAYTSVRFSGETCDFDPEQLKEKKKCLRRLSDVSKEKFRHPKPGEPVVIFSEEIWISIHEESKESVNSLLEIITNTLQDDPETFTRAINQLEQDIGLAGVSRLIKIGSAEKR